MTQYIPKAALLAEIKKKGYYAQTMSDNAINGSMRQFYYGMKQGCVDILSLLNTLEVKEMDSNDAFVKKACEWLSNVSIEDMTYKYGNFDTSEDWYKFIEDFRKYMSL